MSRVDFSPTQMVTALPLVLANGRELPVWDLPDHPGMFGWDDGRGTSIVADIRETESGRRLFVTVCNPFREPTQTELALIQQALFADGTEVKTYEFVQQHGRVTTWTATMQEVHHERGARGSTERQDNHRIVVGAVA